MQQKHLALKSFKYITQQEHEQLVDLNLGGLMMSFYDDVQYRYKNKLPKTKADKGARVIILKDNKGTILSWILYCPKDSTSPMPFDNPAKNWVCTFTSREHRNKGYAKQVTRRLQKYLKKYNLKAFIPINAASSNNAKNVLNHLWKDYPHLMSNPGDLLSEKELALAS